MRFFFAALLLLSSCATFDRTGHLWSEQEVLLQEFNQAKSDLVIQSEKSCISFLALAQKPEFVLQDFARLYGQIYCPEQIPTQSQLTKEDVVQKPWLSELYSTYLYQEAVRTNDPEKLAAAYIEKAKLSTKLKEKADLSIAAYQFAKQTKNETLLKEAEERMYRAAPRLQKNPPSKEWFRIGQDLLLQRDFELARHYFKKIINGLDFSIDEKYQAHRMIRNSYKIEQRKQDFISAAQKLVDWTKKSENFNRLHEAYLTLARAQWTEGKFKRAQKTLATAAKELRGKFPLDEIYWIYGRMNEETGDFQKAIENYQIANNESKERSPTKEKILNQKAWALRKINKYEDSAIHFAELQRITDDSSNLPRYQFWEAMNWQSAGQIEVATALYKKLTQDDPLGYYGLLAYQKLGLMLPPLFLETPGETKPALLPHRQIKIEPRHQFIIRALTTAAERFALEKYIQYQIPDAQRVIQDEKTALFVLGHLAEAGLYQPLYSRLSTLPQDSKNKILLSHPELIFPRKYLDLIEPSAKKFNVEKEFILSIIRQESSFDPMARSSADAFGLMQLLPSIAKQHEERTGIALDHYEDLFRPEKNIPFGTSLISDLQRKYKNQFILTAAAYNANEKAIAGWLKTRLRNDALEFIEDIPYDETKKYVKLVLRNYIFYRRLQNPTKPLEFPEECLNLKRVVSSYREPNGTSSY